MWEGALARTQPRPRPQDSSWREGRRRRWIELHPTVLHGFLAVGVVLLLPSGLLPRHKDRYVRGEFFARLVDLTSDLRPACLPRGYMCRTPTVPRSAHTLSCPCYVSPRPAARQCLSQLSGDEKRLVRRHVVSVLDGRYSIRILVRLLLRHRLRG